MKQRILKQAGVIILLVIIMLMFYGFARARYNIITIDSYAQAADLLQEANEKTLVLFDVDDTLIVSQAPIFWKRYKAQLKQIISKIFTQNSKPYDHYLSIVRFQEVPQLIEFEVKNIIDQLRKRDVPVFALTALNTGSFFEINSLPQWRYEKLDALGINFVSPKFCDTIFKELPEKNSNYPLLYKGILCTNGVPKGKVVGALLDHIKFKPERVIFFDDRIDFLESVAQEMEARNIPFYGFYYQGALRLQADFDAHCATRQLTYLQTHETWLSHHEMRALCTQN